MPTGNRQRLGSSISNYNATVLSSRKSLRHAINSKKRSVSNHLVLNVVVGNEADAIEKERNPYA